MPPLVTVLMCVYNGERYLRAAVDSILAQSFTDFEFLVIDDGSTDGSAALLQGRAEHDRRLRLVRNERNLGLTAALNKGLALAAGQLLARQDADDLSRPQRLQRQVEFLAAHPEVGLLGTRVEVVDETGAPLDGAGFFSAAVDNTGLQQALLVNNPFCHGSVILRRACLDRVGGYDERVGPVEDYDLWLRLAEVTHLANLPEPLYVYRHHRASVSSARRAQQAWDTAQLLERTLQRRFGPRPAPQHLAAVRAHYLEAAKAAFRHQQAGLAQRALAAALARLPAGAPLDAAAEQLTDVFTRQQPVTSAVAVAQAAFAALPPSAQRARLRARLISRLHMREVFMTAHEASAAEWRGHLWPGVRHDPRWLFNRGVLALAWRALVQRPNPSSQP